MEQNKPLTLGSLFDGSGGFPLGGLLAGIRPVWAAEIEPFPIRVTTKRLPFMKHYGDVSTMNGAELEPVDIITFGSPCQDMSIAGKRSGLDGNRSSLFYEAIRIIKEMRCATNGQYPRWICWENVPGAFSSNGGSDFKAVLDSILSIVQPEAQVPPPANGRWPTADAYLGDGWCIAYRTLDAQHWGLAQRRKRIFLVASFTDESAWKVLFKSEGLSGYSAENFAAWQRASRSSDDGTYATGFDGYDSDLTENTAAIPDESCGMSTNRNRIVLNDQGGNRMDVTNNVTCTLRAEAHHPPCVMEKAVFDNHMQDARYTELGATAPTITHRYGTGGNNQPFVVQTTRSTEGPVVTLTMGGFPIVSEDQAPTLLARDFKDPTAVAYGIGQDAYSQGLTSNFKPVINEEVSPPLVAKRPCAVGAVSDDTVAYAVRRLTPTECARLQGFPDWWCSGLGTENPSAEDMKYWTEVFETHRKIMGTSTKPKTEKQIRKWLHDPHSDAAEYKMWGNGVALPCVYFVLAGIVFCTQ